MNKLLERVYARNDAISIVGFPCNQFAYQEPAANKTELLNGLYYVRPGSKYVPMFDIMAKGDVNGLKEHALYTYLKKSCPNPRKGNFVPKDSMWTPIQRDDITWNFSKFIIDRNGKPRFRVLPKVEPDDIEPIMVSLAFEQATNATIVQANAITILNSIDEKYRT